MAAHIGADDDLRLVSPPNPRSVPARIGDRWSLGRQPESAAPTAHRACDEMARATEGGVEDQRGGPNDSDDVAAVHALQDAIVYDSIRFRRRGGSGGGRGG